ncbi:MAG: hypothetical protein MJ211_08725 [Bacteroidales bacterium]|nr:hypothetical protein [Bacteroidales bacterium]
MKKVTLFLLALLINISIYAQYGTCTRVMNYGVRYMPNFYVPQENRTYFVTVESVPQVTNLKSADEICDQIRIPGWKIADNEESAFIKINLNIDYLTIDEQDVVYKEVKEGSGESAKVVKIYAGKLIYHIPYKGSLNSNLDQCVVGDANKKEYISDKESKSYNDAKEYISNNKDIIKDKLIVSEVNNIISTINTTLANKYAYYEINENIRLEFLDSKKSEHYADQQKAIIQLKEIISKCNASCDIKTVASQIQPYIDQFKSIESSLDASDKKQKKTKVALIENLANLYFLIEDFDTSKQYCETLLKDYEEKDGSKLISKIDKIKADLQKHNISSRHFEL